MGATKTIVQKRLGTKLSFGLGDDKLTFTIEDYSGANGFSVPYEAIDFENPSMLTVNNRRIPIVLWLCGVAILFPAFGAISGSANRNGPMTAFNSGLIFGLCALSLCLIFAALFANRLKLFATTYWLFKGPAGTRPIRVMVDKQYDAIVAELKSRWKARLRKLHGTINPANPTKNELAKFKWLKDKGVISEAEYLTATSEIAAANDPAADAASEAKPAKRLSLN